MRVFSSRQSLPVSIICRACCRDEVFGPVLAVTLRRRGRCHRAGNDNAYGLACGIYTRDFAKAWRVGRAIDAGTVWINTYKQFSIGPIRGVKDSASAARKDATVFAPGCAKISLCRHERRAAPVAS